MQNTATPWVENISTFFFSGKCSDFYSKTFGDNSSDF